MNGTAEAVPLRIRMQHRIAIVMRYGVEAAAGKRVTMEQAPGGEHRAFCGTVKFDGLVGVFRAGGHIAARRQQQRREEPLVEPDCEQQCALHL